MNIYFDSLVAQKALQAIKTNFSLVQQCQEALNDISTRHTVRLYWVLWHAGLRRNEIADKFTRDGSVQKFVGTVPSLGVSRQNIRRKIKCRLDNQHLAKCCGHSGTQRQAREVVLGPTPAAKTSLLSFNRTQSRIVIGLLTGHMWADHLILGLIFCE